ncbi:MAG TPA: SRPBCC domain-containing protein [Usitatibacter sp.]|nr:SRPBCC domain-containing protein [Usitatibacter sp.]
MRILFASIAILVVAGCNNLAAAAERMIEKQATVAAPIDEVWKAWTTREGVKSFFAPDANIEARSGGPFEIYMNPYAAPGMKGADDMRVLAVQAPSMISFTWNAPPSQPEIRAQRTVVIVRLKAVDAKTTEVTLRHLGWGEGEKWDATYAYFDRAWGNVLVNLAKRFTDGPIDFTPFLERLKPQPADKK